MIRTQEAQDLLKRLGDLEAPVLTVYADINPANPDNRGGGWRTRVKNALKDIEPIHERKEHAKSLYEEVLADIEEERPTARTMALFARQDEHGKTTIERLDLNVDLPVVDLRHGRVEARWGEPYVAPLVYALDEYQRAGVIHIDGAKWRFFEIFLGEIEECDDVFKEFDEEDWKKLEEASDFIRSGRLRAEAKGDLSGSNKDSWKAKLEHWRHKLYKRLGLLAEKAVKALGIDRLVLMGDETETGVLYSALPRSLREKVVARVTNPEDLNEPNKEDILERVKPALEEAEREGELALLDEIREQPGPKGMCETLDALQFGRLEVIVLPWGVDAEVWYCPEPADWYSCKEEDAKTLCGDDAEKVHLRDRLFRLAENYGTRIELVQGEAEKRLKEEFGGVTGLRRW